MEREIIADYYELIRRTEPLLEAVDRFLGLGAQPPNEEIVDGEVS